MAEYKRPTNEQEFEQNFEQLKPVMNATQAHYESSRCLFCYDAPCVQSCPTGIDIPLFIRQINAGNVEGAAKTIYDSNWLGNACGKVCPTEVLCEGSCVYNHQDVPAIDIGRLQTFATYSVIQSDTKLFDLAEDNGTKVAVIGAGPSGIAVACELRMLGCQVDIYEAKEKPSGLTVYGVAPYKITNEEALIEMEYLQKQFGYAVHYNQTIRSKEDFKQLESDYDAIFLGIGLGNTTSLNMEGEDLMNCIGATEFIEELRMKHHKVSVPHNVIVLGGGNTACDAASESARLGAKNVILAYRRGKESMGAYEFEYDLAKGVGVKGLFNASPVAIIGNDKAEGVRFIKTRQSNGKLKTIEGSEFDIKCDLVIRATGQSKMKDLLNEINALELDAKGRIKVDETTYQTTNPKYFAGGDAVNGGAEVVNAAAQGKMAAIGIHNFLSK